MEQNWNKEHTTFTHVLIPWCTWDEKWCCNSMNHGLLLWVGSIPSAADEDPCDDDEIWVCLYIDNSSSSSSAKYTGTIVSVARSSGSISMNCCWGQTFYVRRNSHGTYSMSELQKGQLIQHIYIKGHTSIHNTYANGNTGSSYLRDILACRWHTSWYTMMHITAHSALWYTVHVTT